MWRMSGVRLRLVVARRSGRPRTRRCCVSQRSSLRNTVISAGAPARDEGPLDGREVARRDTSRRRARRTRRRARGSARRSAPPVPSSVGAVEHVVESQAPARAVAERLARSCSPRYADAEDDVGRRPAPRSSRAGARRTAGPPTSTSAFGIVSVSGRRRVARPPARIATGRLTRTAPWCPRSRSGSALPRGRPSAIAARSRR